MINVSVLTCDLPIHPLNATMHKTGPAATRPLPLTCKYAKLTITANGVRSPYSDIDRSEDSLSAFGGGFKE